MAVARDMASQQACNIFIHITGLLQLKLILDPEIASSP